MGQIQSSKLFRLFIAGPISVLLLLWAAPSMGALAHSAAQACQIVVDALSEHSVSQSRAREAKAQATISQYLNRLGFNVHWPHSRPTSTSTQAEQESPFLVRGRFPQVANDLDWRMAGSLFGSIGGSYFRRHPNQVEIHQRFEGRDEIREYLSLLLKPAPNDHPDRQAGRWRPFQAVSRMIFAKSWKERFFNVALEPKLFLQKDLHFNSRIAEIQKLMSTTKNAAVYYAGKNEDGMNFSIFYLRDGQLTQSKPIFIVSVWGDGPNPMFSGRTKAAAASGTPEPVVAPKQTADSKLKEDLRLDMSSLTWNSEGAGGSRRSNGEGLLALMNAGSKGVDYVWNSKSQTLYMGADNTDSDSWVPSYRKVGPKWYRYTDSNWEPFPGGTGLDILLSGITGPS